MFRLASVILILFFIIPYSAKGISFPRNKKYIKDNYSFFKARFETYVSLRPKDQKFYLYSIAGKVLYYNEMKKEAFAYLEKSLELHKGENISQHLAMLVDLSADLGKTEAKRKYIKLGAKNYKANRYLATQAKLKSKYGIQSLQHELDKIPLGLRNEVYWANFKFLVEQDKFQEAVKFVSKKKLVFRTDFNSRFEKDLVNLAKNRKSSIHCLGGLEKVRKSYSYGVLGCSILQSWKNGKGTIEEMKELEKYFSHFDFEKRYVLKLLKHLIY